MSIIDTKLKILDCTFRDGGYYNRWDFDNHLVKKYLNSVESANIDIIELGFRNFPQNEFFGAFAYTTDAYIDELSISNNMTVCVMIDAASIFKSNLTIDEAIKLLFQVKKKSRVDLVRIAAHFKNIDQCYEIAFVLKKLGYRVALNIMQVSLQSNKDLASVAKKIQMWKIIEVLYFADSLGNMNGGDIKRLINALKLGWNGELGIHTHNNKGLAVSNTLTAIENGVTWADGTMLGMGRGAGNAQTESLLLELEEKHQLDYHASALFDLILSDFTPLKHCYHWGESLLYNLSANYDIHPTYIQDMLTDSRYSNKEIFQAINFMSSIDASHYNKDLLLHAQGNINIQGTWSAEGWCSDREILILGSGKSLIAYRQAIIQYIQIHRPIVIALNVNNNFPEKLIDVYAVSNESKMLNDFEKYQKLTRPLAVPVKLLEQVVKKASELKNELWDYGLIIKNKTFCIDEKECTLPYELSAGYALSLASAGSCSRIDLVGFDGYSVDDNRQVRMNEILSLFSKKFTQDVKSLTPTTYNIKRGSIYESRM